MTVEQIKKRADKRVAAQAALPRFNCGKHGNHVKSYCEGMCEDHECESVTVDKVPLT